MGKGWINQLTNCCFHLFVCFFVCLIVVSFFVVVVVAAVAAVVVFARRGETQVPYVKDHSRDLPVLPQC